MQEKYLLPENQHLWPWSRTTGCFFMEESTQIALTFITPFISTIFQQKIGPKQQEAISNSYLQDMILHCAFVMGKYICLEVLTETFKINRSISMICTKLFQRRPLRQLLVKFSWKDYNSTRCHKRDQDIVWFRSPMNTYCCWEDKTPAFRLKME